MCPSFLKKIDLTLHFQRVEKFTFKNISYGTVLLSVPLAESLLCLQLHGVKLNFNFDWTELKNLMELNLDTVRGIDEQNFIKFLHQKPNIKDFRQSETFPKIYLRRSEDKFKFSEMKTEAPDIYWILIIVQKCKRRVCVVI